MKVSTKLFYCLIAFVAVIASAWLNRLTDDGLGVGWTQDVLRNWEQFGFFNLHGQLVTNPGGYAVETQPQIYPGHRPFGLYPAFFCHHFLGGAAGVTLYYALLAVLVWWSFWRLLGRTEAAFWLGAIAVVTPGYIRWQTTLDPNLAAAVFAFPYCVGVVTLLQKPVWRWPQVAGLAILILVYSVINWSTALVHAMLCAFMLVMPGIPRRRLFIYIGLGVLIAGAVVGYSLTNKLAAAKGAGMTTMLAGYSWGNVGYGINLSTRTALLRLIFINTLGLLPALIFLVWRAGRLSIASRLALGLLPLLTAILSLLFLRNYFSHHPWMGCHYLLLGLLLSAVVLRSRQPNRPTFHPAWGLGSLTIALVFSFGVMSFYHVHKEEEIRLIHFVRDHTLRSTTLLVAQDKDPELAGLMNRLEFDRHYEVIPNGSTMETPGTNTFLLTTSSAAGTLVAQLDNRMAEDSWTKRVLAWYSRIIARRQAGDKVRVNADHYYLYQP